MKRCEGMKSFQKAPLTYSRTAAEQNGVIIVAIELLAIMQVTTGVCLGAAMEKRAPSLCVLLLRRLKIIFSYTKK
jgi:hypothetical protein